VIAETPGGLGRAPADDTEHHTLTTTGTVPPLRTIAVILAGGTGTRVGLEKPKQLLKVAGKTILEHTIEAFEDSPVIDEIIVLMASGWVPEATDVIEKAGFTKVSRVMAGGATRNDTTMVALGAVGEDDCNLLFHDAVRPLVEHRIIRECVEALATYRAVDVAIPSADTIIEVADGVIVTIPARDGLRRGQTPQAFRASTIRQAYAHARNDPNFTATDDCSVVLRYLPDEPIYVVEGSERNIKVTHPIDVFLVDQLFRLGTHSTPREKDPAIYADRMKGRTLVVFGGSYGIGAEIADVARELGAQVFSFSRSQTGTAVQDPAAVAAALAEAHEQTGRIDYVVVTAGVLHRSALTESSEEVIRESIDINLTGPVLIAQASARYLTQSKGQLLLFTSSSYTRGRAGYSLYSSTKAAVVNLTQALAEEWNTLGIRVNCINPERTSTPMRTNAFGAEPGESLLSARTVALSSIDVLVSDESGHVMDVRLSRSEEADGNDPAAAIAHALELAQDQAQDADLAPERRA
jgi:ribitol-5-phosphate 2-dehydrogenase (NADP+) / D-ribitol-5-phosphate cytidylyltransferase